MGHSVVSAPGKVLIVGGYLVLDPGYTGAVLTSSARIYSDCEFRELKKENEIQGTMNVNLTASQFLWSLSYVYHFNEEDDCGKIVPIYNGTRNKFVETAVVNALSFAFQFNQSKFEEISKKYEMNLNIYGDNDFYSQRSELKHLNLPISSDSLKQIPRFNKFFAELHQVPKTGLGSSAALITSIVSSILCQFKVITLKDEKVLNDELFLIHSLSQFCHCFAQGKIGSGFDVASAVFGTQRYRRFSPNILEKLFVAKEDSTPPLPLLSSILQDKSLWDQEITGFNLPTNFSLFLGDISTGSHTPSMVSNVLEWRKNNQDEAKELWDNLGEKNDLVVKLFQDLEKQSKNNETEYLNSIEKCSTTNFTQWKDLILEGSQTIKLIYQLYEAFQEVRGYLRTMGQKSKVPIEPSEQTKLLDATMKLNGIIMAGVPGAGGYDAIFCIYVGGDTVKTEIEKLWVNWKELDVCPLLRSTSSKGIQLETEIIFPH